MLKTRHLLVASTALAALIASTANAQTTVPQTPPEDDSQTTVKEIVVTAGRREQSLQDVPVSLAVVTGETIKELAITNLDELSQYVPGLTVTEGGEQTGISIRGFGASLNFGIDQSVGLFVDEIYAGRERQFRGTFLDVGRVEVLKGPQGTLFGKNTIAGAVTITSARPTQETFFSVRGEYGPVTNRRAIEGVANGRVLHDTLSGRLAVRFSKEDGYIENTLTGDDEEQEEDKVGRASLLWKPTEKLTVYGKLEYSEYDRIGRNFQISEISGLAVGRPIVTSAATLLPLAVPADVGAAAQLGIYRFYDPNFNFGKDYDTSKQRESSHVEATGAALDIAYDFGPVLFRSITGYSGYESQDERDVDWSPTPFLFEPITQEFSQVSQEFRIVSDIGERFDYIAGLYYFKTDFYVDRRTDVDINLFFPDRALDLVTRKYTNLRFLDQTAETHSAYAQGTYHITDRLHLTGGLRYSSETKNATDRLDIAQFRTTRFLDESIPADALLIAQARALGAASLAGRHSFRGESTEENITPEGKLSWDVNEDTLLYVSATKGYKGGGFNSNSSTQNERDFGFRPETVVGYEFGGKTVLLDGTMNVNFALFRQDFEDLQLSIYTGEGFFLTNVGTARSQGAEADFRWQPTEQLSINGAISLIDAKYTSNFRGACNIAQQNFGQPGCFRTVAGPGNVPPAASVQNYGDKRFAPRYTGSFGVGYTQPVGSGLELLLRADTTFTAQGEFPLDDTIVQPARALLDLGATLRPTGDRNWSLGVLVQNALDHDYYFFEFEAPSQVGTRIGFIAPPRRVVLKASYDF